MINSQYKSKNIKLPVYATTAQLPGIHYKKAISILNYGLKEGMWGHLKTDYMQICPQSAGVVSTTEAEKLVSRFPHIKFRCHANTRVLDRHVLWDASTYSEETKHYYKKLIDIMLIFNQGSTSNKNTMSIHAGYKKNCSRQKLLDNIKNIMELFNTYSQGTIHVAIEGLYPNHHVPQHIDTWDGYELLLKNYIPFALDLSHLNIVAHKERTWNVGLIKELLRSKFCKEIHVSDNNGSKDNHQMMSLSKKPYWLDILNDYYVETMIENQKQDNNNKELPVIFSEGVLLPRRGLPDWWEKVNKNI